MSTKKRARAESADFAAPAKVKEQPFWLIYISLLISGIILLADAVGIEALDRWTARLGIALTYSAIALLVANGRKAGFVAVAILWISVIIAYIV